MEFVVVSSADSGCGANWGDSVITSGAPLPTKATIDNEGAPTLGDDFDHEGESDFGADEKGSARSRDKKDDADEQGDAAQSDDDAAEAQGTADLLEFLTGDGE